MNRRLLRNFFLCIFVGLTIPACVESIKAHSTFLARLKNRGPVGLSADNPYLAANLFLSKEMDLSPELRGFVEHRGAPAALEIRHELFGALSISLYYASERQLYTLEESESAWIIRGPFPIEPEVLSRLAEVTTFQRAALPSASEIPNLEATRTPIIVPMPPTATPVTFSSFYKAQKAETVRPTATPIPVVSDETLVSRLVRGHEKEAAEVSPKGDIVHYVTYTSENLVALSRWYTLDAGNVGRLARINNMKSSKALSLGDTIIIPSYMIRNKIRLTEEAAEKLRE